MVSVLVEVQASTMERDRGFEVLDVAENPRRPLDPLFTTLFSSHAAGRLKRPSGEEVQPPPFAFPVGDGLEADDFPAGPADRSCEFGLVPAGDESPRQPTFSENT
jgi:hypothetical protein